jgi:hypothetical protein
MPPTFILLLLGIFSLKSSEGVKKKSKLESRARIIKNEPIAEVVKINKTVANLCFLKNKCN